MNAVMLACECAAWYAAQGMTLLDGINALYRQYGYYRNKLLTKQFAGEDGMRAMEEMTSALRKDPPRKIEGRAVVGMTDYLNDKTGLIPSDVLEFRLAGDAKLIVRPSGTEPKLKMYLSVREGSAEEADRETDRLSAAAEALMAGGSSL